MKPQLVFDVLKGGLVQTVQQLVKRDRKGELVDHSLLRSIVRLFLIMGVARTRIDFKTRKDVLRVADSEQTAVKNRTYEMDFEAPFLRLTNESYGAESRIWTQSMTALEYCNMVHTSIENEIERARLFLNRSTEPKLRRGLVRVLVQDQLDWLLGSPEALSRSSSTTASSGPSGGGGGGAAASGAASGEDDTAGLGGVEKLFAAGGERDQELRNLWGLVTLVTKQKGRVRFADAVRDRVLREGLQICKDRRAGVKAATAGGPGGPGGGAKKGPPKTDEEKKAAAARAKEVKAAKAALSHDPDFVGALVALRRRYNHVCMVICDGDTTVQRAATEALKTVVNMKALGAQDPHPTFSQLASFADMILKGRRPAGLGELLAAAEGGKGSGGGDAAGGGSAAGALHGGATGGGTDRLTAQELGEAIEDIRGLFDQLSDKDLFKQAYKTGLGTRLLAGTSTSQDAEKQMISRLKEAEGAQFTNSLENMIGDFVNSRVLMGEWQKQWGTEGVSRLSRGVTSGTGSIWRGGDALRQSGLDPSSGSTMASARAFDLEARILCNAYWPPGPKGLEKIPLPPAMAIARSFWGEAYGRIHEQRKLELSLVEGSAEIGYCTPKGKTLSLSVKPVQAVALLTLDALWRAKPGVTSATVSDLAGALQLPREQAIRCIHPMAFAKHCCILEVQPAEGLTKGTPEHKAAAMRLRKGKLEEKDRIVPRAGFASPRRAISVPFLALTAKKSSKEDYKLDRRSVIDAAIVRVMKARKQLDMQGLIPEVSRQIRLFDADVRQIRTRIDGLIDQDYLERDEVDSKVLRYVA